MRRRHGSKASGRATDRPRRVAKATQSRQSVAGSGDPRCARTRALILEAFASLCGERGDEGASVAEICRRARVNRATFYRHFEDRADMLDRGLEGFFAEIGDRIDPPTVEEGRTSQSAARRIELLFELIEERAKLMKLVLSGSAGATLRARAESFCETYIEARRVARLSRPDERYTLPRAAMPRALASLFMGLASWWLDHPGSCSAREIASRYLAFISSGLLEGRTSPAAPAEKA